MARRMRERRSRSRSRIHSGVGSVHVVTRRAVLSACRRVLKLAETSGAAENNTSSSAGNIMTYGLRNNLTLSCRFSHLSSVLHEASFKPLDCGLVVETGANPLDLVDVGESLPNRNAPNY